MEKELRVGDLVKVKVGPRLGQIGKIAEKSNKIQTLYQVEFPGDPATVSFFNDEIEKAEGIPCPHCIKEGRWTQLFQPYWTEGGWVQDCPIHGKLYLWGLV